MAGDRQNRVFLPLTTEIRFFWGGNSEQPFKTWPSFASLLTPFTVSPGR